MFIGVFMFYGHGMHRWARDVSEIIHSHFLEEASVNRQCMLIFYSNLFQSYKEISCSKGYACPEYIFPAFFAAIADGDSEETGRCYHVNQ